MPLVVIRTMKILPTPINCNLADSALEAFTLSGAI